MFELDKDAMEVPDFEMLSDSFLEQLERVMQTLDGFQLDFPNEKETSTEDDDEDEEDYEAEYAETYGGSQKELKKYVEKFKEYAKDIKEGLEAIYGAMAESGKNGDKKHDGKASDFGIKSPHERGHKMGCGCPGCSAYREFFGIKVGGGRVYQSVPGSTVPDAAFAAKRKEAGKYEETNSKPCGGRLYNFFHGRRAELKNVLGQYAGRLNLGWAGY